MLGLKSAVGTQDRIEAAQQQPRADQERERQGDFGADEHLAYPALPRGPGGAALAFAKRGHERALRGLEGGDQARGKAGQHADEDRKEQHAMVDRRKREP